ncbi:TIGR03757 family integrating conjugative element protein [Acidovorax sp. SUPP1855]|uniref:TIGR03757 family integrating conjugative element protein n=1 Tax=Acidovorax sp. SUPP1855 TaxID=431774 RepID=UPI0024E16326|nr:TIGR03757 family integrating conjugative element protein [Acidovorax sp. SUPP1855]
MPSVFVRPSSNLRGGPLLTAAIALAGALASTFTQAAEVKVFTLQSMPLIGVSPEVAVVHLDAASQIESRIGAQLPANPERAQTIARERLDRGGEALQRELAAAYQGVADAWSLGITTLPAVVVDRRYVVYGEPDVAKASARIAAYRKAHP